MPALPGALSTDLPPEAASIWDEPPIAGLDSPETKEYEAQAQLLARQGLDFSDIFAGLCRYALDGNARARSDPRAELRNLFRGLIRWTRNGGKPAFQGRADWGLHFIYGGYLAASYGNALPITETDPRLTIVTDPPPTT